MKTKKMTLLTLVLSLLVPEINNLNAQTNTSMSEMLKSLVGGQLALQIWAVG